MYTTSKGRILSTSFTALLLLGIQAPAYGHSDFFTDNLFALTTVPLGIQAQSLNPELRVFFGAPRDAGVLVARIQQDSIAKRHGVKVGDVIIALNGHPIVDPHALWTTTMGPQPDSQLRLSIIRQGNEETIILKMDSPTGRWHSWHRQDFWRSPTEWREHLSEELRKMEERIRKLEQGPVY